MFSLLLTLFLRPDRKPDIGLHLLWQSKSYSQDICFWVMPLGQRLMLFKGNLLNVVACCRFLDQIFKVQKRRSKSWYVLVFLGLKCFCFCTSEVRRCSPVSISPTKSGGGIRKGRGVGDGSGVVKGVARGAGIQLPLLLQIDQSNLDKSFYLKSF